MLYTSKDKADYAKLVAENIADGKVPCWPYMPYPAPPEKYVLGVQLPPDGEILHTADQLNEVLALFRTALIKWGLTNCATGTTEDDLQAELPQIAPHRGLAAYNREVVTRSLSRLMATQIAKIVLVSGRSYADLTGWAPRANLVRPLGHMPCWPMYPVAAVAPDSYTASQLKTAMRTFQDYLVDWAMRAVQGVKPDELRAELPVVSFDTPEQPPVYTRAAFEAAYREVMDNQLALLATLLNTSVFQLLNPKG